MKGKEKHQLIVSVEEKAAEREWLGRRGPQDPYHNDVTADMEPALCPGQEED